MLRLNYKYPNNNVEFISDIIKYSDSLYSNYYWYITDLDIIANDRAVMRGVLSCFNDDVPKIQSNEY